VREPGDPASRRGGGHAAPGGRSPAALIAALDDVLTELEEMTVEGIAEVPDALGRRAAELIAEAMRLEDRPAVPGKVTDLMERVYAAEDAAMLRRRRAGWGLE
jgi:sirohydrochlorin ferrochelatase